MPRRTSAPHRPARLAPLQFEGVALRVAGREDDVARRLAEAQRIARAMRLRWRAVAIDARAQTVLLRPGPRAGRVTPARAWELAHRLGARRDVAFAEPAFVMPGEGPFGPRARRGAVTEGPPLPGTDACDWALALCKVPQAWALAPASGGAALGQGVVVAHPDTGWTAHPELANTAVDAAAAFDFVGGVPGANDPLDPPHPGHGTSTASVIASDALATAGAFVSGVAPLATIMPLRVSSSVVHFSWLRLTAALWHAIGRQAHVVSMSLGGPMPSGALEEALGAAVDANLVLVAAAGNQWPFVVYPARYDEVVACAAVNILRKRWAGSAAGADVDVAAPGESVWRARAEPTGFDVARSSGTSYATAHVAGMAALWLAHHGRANLVAKYGRGGVPAVFKELLTTAGVAGTPASWPDDVMGAGIANAHALLSAPLPPRPHAAGMRVRAGVRSVAANPFDRVAAYFPGIDPERLRDWLARELRTAPSALPGRLATLGDEIVFHLTADPAAYAGVARALLRPRARGAAAATRALFRRASPTLARALR
ncbi:MAG: hypothetical protein BroJett026_17140 [Betaproteobacteria bacterium]|nr:MAG: hypothetical protein BroJett026_17140 [Betaproteobacteria bacterium]